MAFLRTLCLWLLADEWRTALSDLARFRSADSCFYAYIIFLRHLKKSQKNNLTFYINGNKVRSSLSMADSHGPASLHTRYLQPLVTQCRIPCFQGRIHHGNQ